jgi:hypothetical protein
MKRITLSLIVISLLLQVPAWAAQPGRRISKESGRTVRKAVAIWQQPHDIRTRNLFYGSGGRAGQPKSPFRFIEEDAGGSNPKFVVEDAKGIRWKVKLGEEAKPETAATHLLWAVGYFTDLDYYLPRIQVSGLARLKRGQQYVSSGGMVHGARLERSAKKVGDWSWFDNPFVGTKEFNGLRVMMALLNNWDLKQVNNAIYDGGGRELRYLVSDLGGTFGRTGGRGSRSKGNLEDFSESKFIDKTTPTTVDLVLHSRPSLLYAVAVPYYLQRARMEKVAEDIPRAHALWIGQWLARLSDKQMVDAFLGAGYTPQEAEAYAGKLQERINLLNALIEHRRR